MSVTPGPPNDMSSPPRPAGRATTHALPTPHGTVTPRADLRRLWAGFAVSELGSAVGSGALPLIAILALHASQWQVSLLAAVAGIASAAVVVPLGPFVEFHRKRPVMIGADLLRFAALGSLPVAAACHALTYPQLCLVAVAHTGATIVFTAASTAHLKTLVPVADRAAANSRFATTAWTATTVGPPIGGQLVSVLGATAAVAVDAVSFLASAVSIRRLRGPEPPPPPPGGNRRRGGEVLAGWRYITHHSGLHRLFWNAMLFGGSLTAASPLMAVFMLRDLGLHPWQYGLALGLPGLGGIAGSLAVTSLARRYGSRPVLLASGVARSLWLGLVPLAPHGTGGLVLITVSDTLLLACAGVFNPTFVTYRMDATSDAHMARVNAAWAVSSKSVQPLFIAAAGLLATATSVRTALAVAALTLAASALLLPWRADKAGAGTAAIRGDQWSRTGAGRGGSTATGHAAAGTGPRRSVPEDT